MLINILITILISMGVGRLGGRGCSLLKEQEFEEEKNLHGVLVKYSVKLLSLKQIETTIITFYTFRKGTI